MAYRLMDGMHRYGRLLWQFASHGAHRFAVIEGNANCNRRCPYCAVPQRYVREGELTVRETFQVVDWLWNQGYSLITWLGGEPLADYVTEEGITFLDHTLEVVRYATRKGMVVNVTTNGDYATRDIVEALERASLHSLTLSLHTYTPQGLDHLIDVGRMAAAARIIPTVQAILTRQRAGCIPAVAAKVVQNGIPFGVGIVQEKGGGFSKPGDRSLPTVEQQSQVLSALRHLKAFGFVRNNANYLAGATGFYPNGWVCDPDRDTFIHIGAGGTVDVCSDTRTELKIGDIQTLRSDKWRESKRDRVLACSKCLYHCYYEAETPALIQDIPTAAVALLIRAGGAGLAEKWGQYAVAMTRRSHTSVDWDLDFSVGIP